MAFGNVAGEITIEPGYILVAKPRDAWQRLRDLHDRAVGEERQFDTPSVAELDSETAFVEYSNAAVAVLAQLAVVPEQSQAVMLTSLCEYAVATDSMAGLEGPFLSGVSGLAHGGNAEILDLAAQTLLDVGLPSQLGGGAQSATVFDAETGQLAFPGSESLAANFEGLGLDAETAESLRSFFGIPGSLGGTVFGDLPGVFDSGPVPGGNGEEFSPESDYATVGGAIGAAGGAVAGGIYGFTAGIPTGPGAFVTGGAGALLGAGLGATIGGAIGGGIGVVVGLVKEDAPPVSPGVLPGGVPAPAPTPGDDGGTGPPAPPPGDDGGTGPPAPPPDDNGPPAGPPAPPPEGEGGMTGPHGTSQPAPDPQKCLEPDDSGLGFGGSDSGLGWATTRVPGGPGLAALGTYIGATTLSMTTLPATDDGGGLDLGYLSSIPDFLEFVVQPERGGRAVVSRGRVSLLPSGGGSARVGRTLLTTGKMGRTRRTDVARRDLTT
jgi:hypothetical protein